MADNVPGNSSSTVTLTAGSSYSGSIDTYADTDWYRVYLTYGYAYQIWVEGSYSNNGTLVDPYVGIFNSSGTFQHGNNNSSIYTLDAYVTTIPSSSGYFFVSAEEYGHDGTGTYKVTFWQDELASIESAATVSVQGSVVGRIGWQNDISDWYSVNLTAGIVYQFDLVGLGQDGSGVGLTLADPYLFLRNSAGTILLGDDDAGLSTNSRIYYTPSISGTYFLDAQENGNNANGIYRLIVNSTPLVGALSLGTSQSGNIDFSGDIDLYSVSLTAGLTYGFAVDGITLSDPYLEVLNSAGASLLYFDDDSGPNLNSYLTFTPETSGTYYLAARESGNNATGSYTAQVWQIPIISIGDASINEGNSGTSLLSLTVRLSNPSPYAVSVTATTRPVTASAGADYITATQLVTIPAGQTSASFSVSVNGDTGYGPDEVVAVELSSPSNGILSTDKYGVGWIRNDDAFPISNLPSDPLFEEQWHLFATNTFRVWPDYTGKGVRVAVFDQGIDPIHPDLDGNLLTTLGRNSSNLSLGGSPVLASDNHGTAVAGVIAAERNGSGGVGVAYDAKLVSIYDFTGSITNGFSYAANFDILNNSWGYAGNPSNYFGWFGSWAFFDNFSSSTHSAAGQALASLVANGRSGLGTVVVQSAGNSFEVGDDTNLHNFQNSQYILTVAATDYFGSVTEYSSPGASILLSAPGGDTSLVSEGGVLTTDRTGSNGYSSTESVFVQGTSFSSPVVSGIVALMLEANPNLGYRDVHEILAYTARKTAETSNDWRYNGATNWNGGGLHFDSLSHDLGFGLIDARSAVRLAESWTGKSHTAANRQQVANTHTVSKAIPDGGGIGATSSASDAIHVSQSIDVERAEVTLNVTHPFVGDLSILLSAPSGTTSFLLWRPQKNALNAYGTQQNDIHFTFDTVLDWGENSVGTWSISIYDNAYGDVGTFDSWTLNLIGKPASADDTYIYTDEFSESCAAQAARATLTDPGGIDTLNAAACSTVMTLNLEPGSVSTIDGCSLTIAAGTVIENAYGGDRADTISGNSSNNELRGMRGNDTLTGGAGNDTFWFSTVSDGVDTITDFSVGDRIYVKGATFSNAISVSDGAALALNEVSALTNTDLTTLLIGTDSGSGYDLAINLTGKFSASQLRATGSFIEINSPPTLAVPPAPTLVDTIADDSFPSPTGTLTGSDVNDNTTLTYGITDGTDAGTTITKTGIYGTLTVTKAGGAWNYAPNDGSIESLKSGASDSFTVSVSDGSLSASQSLVINLTGANDPTVFGGATSGNVAEDGTLTASGTLSVSDRDTGDALITAQTATLGTYGSFSIGTNGTWSYTLANSQANIQSLKAGQTVTDSFSVATAGGSTQTITLSIAGANDAPSLTSGSTGTIAENAATSTVIYTATASDVDATTTQTYSLTGTDASLLSINSTTGEVTLKTAADFETKTSYNFNVIASDGSLTDTKAVTVSVTNIDEATTGSITFSGTATQGQTLTAGNTLADPDGLGTLSYQWNADNLAISGATGDTFTLTGAQVGKVITVSASFTDGYGTKVSITSSPTVTVVGYQQGSTSNDDILGTASADTLLPGSGADQVRALAGNDTLILSADGVWGNGYLAANAGSPGVKGTAQEVSMAGKNRFADVLDGGADTDTLQLTEGSDAFFLHDAHSLFHISVPLTNDGRQLLSAARCVGIEQLSAGTGDDLIDLTSSTYIVGNVQLDGGGGNDILWANAGNDILLGGDGNDVLFGGAGNDTLTGGSGADLFQFASGGKGADRIDDFQPGIDTLQFFKGQGSTDVSIALSGDHVTLTWGEQVIDLSGLTSTTGSSDWYHWA